MSDFVVGKAYSERSNNVMQELLTMAEKITPENMAEIIKKRSKTMTVEELKKTISKMPNDAEVKADDSTIKKITATLNKDGDIIAVNIEI